MAEQTKFNLSEDDMNFLRKMNDFQLEGRYPDYKQNIYRIYKFDNTDSILKKVNQLRLCLLKELQLKK